MYIWVVYESMFIYFTFCQHFMLIDLRLNFKSPPLISLAFAGLFKWCCDVMH